MKMITIKGSQYPFKTSFLAITKICAKYGKNFGEIGDLLQERTIEVLYDIIADGICKGTGGDMWTAEYLDEIVGTDTKAVSAMGDFLTEVLGVEKNDSAPEAKAADGAPSPLTSLNESIAVAQDIA